MYDSESGLYYLQSRYYDSEIGRFINADALVSTGQGLLGNNMFTYCGNGPTTRVDSTGTNYRYAAALVSTESGGLKEDYVIYYHHPESSENLDGPATQNHSVPKSNYIAVSSFDELAYAMNNLPTNADDVFIYVHGDEYDLCFYYAQYYSAKDIAECFNELDITGNIYLFSVSA